MNEFERYTIADLVSEAGIAICEYTLARNADSQKEAEKWMSRYEAILAEAERRDEAK